MCSRKDSEEAKVKVTAKVEELEPEQEEQHPQEQLHAVARERRGLRRMMTMTKKNQKMMMMNIAHTRISRKVSLDSSLLNCVAEDDEASNSESVREEDNPLPGFVDPVTLCEVVRPAISPYGHVMAYESWVRWLNQEQHRNVCPWTKKTVKKRDLVILTWENIDQYRDKIANWNKEGEKSNGNNTIPM